MENKNKNPSTRCRGAGRKWSGGKEWSSPSPVKLLLVSSAAPQALLSQHLVFTVLW